MVRIWHVDDSKTTTSTDLFTGKVIGICSMTYGFATSNEPSHVHDAS